MNTINKIPDGNPFKVPDNYFEEVNLKIIASTIGKGGEKKKKGLYRRLRPYIAVAASIALLAVLGYSAFKIFLPSNNKAALSEISMEEFSSEYLKDIDIQTLEKEVEPGELTDKSSSISNPEIVDYLLNENIDLNDIYELL